MNYTNEQASKKKYLVPIVALLICGVAFVGSAYAYSASIETSNDLAVKSYEITVNDKDVIELDGLYLQFNSKKVDGKVTYTAVDFTKDIVVKIKDNANDTAKFKITSATVTSSNAPEGLNFTLTPKSTSEAGATATLTLKASGTLGENVVPLEKYNVKIVIETEAA